MCCHWQELEVLSLPQRLTVATQAGDLDHAPMEGLSESGPSVSGIPGAAQILTPLQEAVHQLHAAPAGSAQHALQRGALPWLSPKFCGGLGI